MVDIVDWRRLVLDVRRVLQRQGWTTDSISRLDVGNRGGGSIHGVARRGSIADWGARELRRNQSVVIGGLD